ncbi:MAG TPA: endonuclease/exonuclease/phosphatase family protein, partial [Candidatus Paceibacterota bacterium]|nr:endonuclease/exonuclease/phosphatase family protein [Candidatus Paceibacterota bacterium]
DFNILPDTESMSILENGMRNLVKEFGVESTRTPLYRHYSNPEEPNYADYVLVSPDVRVTRFEVLPDVVSDHSPLLLEFT